MATRLEFNVWLSIRAFAKPADIELHEGRHCGDRFLLFSERYTVWLVIFAGTNFREIGQNSDFRNVRGFNFRNQ